MTSQISYLAFLNFGCSACKMNALDKMILTSPFQAPGPMIGYLEGRLNHAGVREYYRGYKTAIKYTIPTGLLTLA